MRKFCAVLFFLLLPFACNAESSSGPDYELTIDGVEHNLALGEEVMIKLKSGVEVPVVLKKREFGSFSTKSMSFEFPGQYSVATTQVDETTTQHIIVTASGTMMLVQQYSGSIPDQMLEVMFDTMVEEPKALGYEIEKTDLNRAISNQGVLNGVRAHYKGGDDDVTIDITSTTTKDGGFLILTMIDEASSQDEIPIIEGFWKSVTLKE